MWLRPLVSHFFFLNEQTINLFLQLEHFIKTASSMALFLCSFHQKKKKLLNQCTSNVSKRVLTPSLQIGLTVNYLCINPYHWGTRGLSIHAKATMLWQLMCMKIYTIKYSHIYIFSLTFMLFCVWLYNIFVLQVTRALHAKWG